MRVLQLGHGAQVARFQLGNVRLGLPLQRHQVAEPLGRITREIVDGAIRFDRSRDRAQHRDAPGERIGDGLPGNRHVRRGVGRLDRRVRAVLVNGREVALRRRRHVTDEGIEQRLDPDDAQP